MQPAASLGDLASMTGKTSPDRSNDDRANSDSESNSDVADDMDDVFSLKVIEESNLPKMYSSCHQWRWCQVSVTLAGNFRDNFLMPVDKNGELFCDIDSGTCLPRWHCAFAGCAVNESTERLRDLRQNAAKSLWGHI